MVGTVGWFTSEIQRLSAALEESKAAGASVAKHGSEVLAKLDEFGRRLQAVEDYLGQLTKRPSGSDVIGDSSAAPGGEPVSPAPAVPGARRK